MGGTNSKTVITVKDLKEINLDSEKDITDIINSKGFKLLPKNLKEDLYVCKEVLKKSKAKTSKSESSKTNSSTSFANVITSTNNKTGNNKTGNNNGGNNKNNMNLNNNK